MNTLRKSQQGLASVEFAVGGLLAFIVLFGAIEMGRMLFTLNTLREATYRGARVAVVCPINDTRIQQAAIFDAAGTGTGVLPNLTAANIQVRYLDSDGNPLGTPASDPDFSNIRYVRVEIVDYVHDFFMPGANFTFTTRSYPSTLPKESLGIAREGGGAVPC